MVKIVAELETVVEFMVTHTAAPETVIEFMVGSGTEPEDFTVSRTRHEKTGARASHSPATPRNSPNN